jgi:phosphatidylglycerophosphate synthase
VPGYFYPLIPFIVYIGFILIIYSLWIYSVAKSNKSKVEGSRVNKLSSIFFNLCCLFFPVIWVLNFYRFNPNAGLFFSILCIIALVEMIYFSSRSLMSSHTGLKKIWIIIGLLIPLIGVWYIQPKLNSIYNDAVALEMKESPE